MAEETSKEKLAKRVGYSGKIEKFDPAKVKARDAAQISQSQTQSAGPSTQGKQGWSIEEGWV